MSAAEPPRTPPGQEAVDDWPVLHVGSVPTFDPATWQLAVAGAVEERRVLGWRAFRSLPHAVVTVDLHCVTGWSRLGLRFGGVLLKELLALARPRPEAAYVAIGDGRGYEVTISLEDARSASTLLASELEGEPLSATHGGPLRAVVPARYAWKSVKWVRAIELLGEARPGFWDRRGYHAGADPWASERMA